MKNLGETFVGDILYYIDNEWNEIKETKVNSVIKDDNNINFSVDCLPNCSIDCDITSKFVYYSKYIENNFLNIIGISEKVLLNEIIKNEKHIILDKMNSIKELKNKLKHLV